MISRAAASLQNRFPGCSRSCSFGAAMVLVVSHSSTERSYCRPASSSVSPSRNNPEGLDGDVEAGHFFFTCSCDRAAANLPLPMRLSDGRRYRGWTRRRGNEVVGKAAILDGYGIAVGLHAAHLAAHNLRTWAHALPDQEDGKRFVSRRRSRGRFISAVPRNEVGVDTRIPWRALHLSAPQSRPRDARQDGCAINGCSPPTFMIGTLAISCSGETS